jgi:hypothetical protein
MAVLHPYPVRLREEHMNPSREHHDGWWHRAFRAMTHRKHHPTAQ